MSCSFYGLLILLPCTCWQSPRRAPVSRPSLRARCARHAGCRGLHRRLLDRRPDLVLGCRDRPGCARARRRASCSSSSSTQVLSTCSTWRIDSGSAKPAAATEEQPTIDTGQKPIQLFLGSLALTMANPKTAIFFLALLPTVVRLEELTLAGFLEIVAVISVVLPLVLGGYVFLAARARRMFEERACGAHDQPQHRRRDGVCCSSPWRLDSSQNL